MSLFRAITAEEEAATALILALKQQIYPGAARFIPRNHSHKAAIWAILQAIGRGMVEKGMLVPNIAIAKEGAPRLEVSIDLGSAAGIDQPLWARPDHPFNVVIHSDEKGPFEVHRWERELSAIAADKGFADIGSHIKAEANLRNRILYASDKGVPAVRFNDNLLIDRLSRVTWILSVTIGILQTTALQLLVVQAVEGLLKALERFEESSFEFPAFGSTKGRHLSLTEQADGGMKLELLDGFDK